MKIGSKSTSRSIAVKYDITRFGEALQKHLYQDGVLLTGPSPWFLTILQSGVGGGEVVKNVPANNVSVEVAKVLVFFNREVGLHPLIIVRLLDKEDDPKSLGLKKYSVELVRMS